MTEQVEELTRGEALARVAVLEAELAELRKRVCVPDASTMARVLSDRAASACCVDPDDNWKIYGQEFIEDVRAMLAAAPAPVERLATDGGRNQRFEGLFEGETPDQRDARLASAAPVERVEQYGYQAIFNAIAAATKVHGSNAVAISVEAFRRSLARETPQPAPTACTGKNCGSTDPNLHSADCFAEHERAITPNAARKAPPEDPLCGIEYRADGEANFYTLSAAAGSWVARIQFNGRLYPHEQERILSAMLGDRNVRYGDGYYDGYWSARKDCAFEQDVAGLELAAKYVEQRAEDYDRDHGLTEPDTGHRTYPGDGAEYMEELDNIAAGIRALAHQSGGAR